MTKADYTHLAVVADRSGSMYSIVKDMNDGLEAFLKEQDKEPGTLLVDITTFDNQVETPVVDGKVSDVSFPVIFPRGTTALLDGLGTTITNLGERLAKLDEGERPGTVIVLVVTDGGENASREYKADQVKKLVETQQSDYNWKFVFLGANIDSFSVAGNLGFHHDATVNYAPNSSGVSTVLRSASAYVSTTRGGGDASFYSTDTNSK